MKQKLWLFLCLICLALPAGCADSPADSTAAGLPPKEYPAGFDTTEPQFLTCRIVDGAETGHLVLAEHGGNGVYTLGLTSLPEGALPEEPLRNGQLINVSYGAFTEAWPMGFGGVTAIEIAEGSFDNRCTLYLKVLEDLWEVDPALSESVEYIGMDLTQTSLTPAEQAAVGWVFAGRHGAELVSGSLEELIEQGWITATPLSTSGTNLSEPEHFFYEWENGCHFSITEQPMEGSYSLTPVTFNAAKWRSSLGAYRFCDCTAAQSALGEWSEYHIGAEAIS